jgi:hypothetical protein
MLWDLSISEWVCLVVLFHSVFMTNSHDGTSALSGETALHSNYVLIVSYVLMWFNLSLYSKVTLMFFKFRSTSILKECSPLIFRVFRQDSCTYFGGQTCVALFCSSCSPVWAPVEQDQALTSHAWFKLKWTHWGFFLQCLFCELQRFMWLVKG